MADYNLQGSTPLSKRCTTTVAQHSAVMLDGTTVDNIVVTTGITSPCIGFAMVSGVANKMIPIQDKGIAKAIASTAIAANAEVMCDASGRVTTASGATANSVGRALDAAGAQGDVIRVQLYLSAKGPANT